MTDARRHLSMVVFDFSGTLSIDAPAFGEPETLMAALRRSGLADLGVDSPQVFWDAVVHPTWQQGSTTGRGYAAVLTDAITALAARQQRPLDGDALRRCAHDFTRRYLAASTVAPEWGPWLRRLVQRGLPVVIATDHYADATSHITGELRRLGLRAGGLGDTSPSTAGAIRIANSADVGCHKSGRGFWEAVERAVGGVRRVRTIDDFGANEDAGDRYADPAAVAERRRGTVTLLADVFAADVDVETFLVEPRAAVSSARRWRQAFTDRVDGAGRRTVAWAERS